LDIAKKSSGYGCFILYSIKITQLTLEENKERPGSTPFAQTYFHGTKADLKVGDLIEADHTASIGQKKMQDPGHMPVNRPVQCPRERFFPCGQYMK